MKLFVDDIRPAPDESWMVARSVLSAIRALSHFAFEEVSLDHDISHQVSIGGKLERPFPCEETFEPVAHYLHARAASSEIPFQDWKRPRITIHTSNPVGKDHLLRALGGLFTVKVEMRGLANRLELEL